MTDRITMKEINRIAETNPQAASLALGMQLMADFRAHTDKIVDGLLEQKDLEISNLRKEVAFLRPLAEKWMVFQSLLKDKVVYE
jgi:hypothetical protein